MSARTKLLGEHFVTFKHVVMSLPVIAVAATGFAGFVISSSAARAESVREALTKHEQAEVQYRIDTTTAVRETQADVRALYQYLATGRPQPQLAQPVKVSSDGGQE